MTKITISHIDRSTIRYIDAELNRKLKDLGDELGISITIQGGSYSSSTYTAKLDIKLVDTATGQVKQDPYFLSLAASHGLDINLISRDGFKLVGYKGSRPKFPWDVMNVHTKQTLKATRGWVDARFKKGTPGSIPSIQSQINPPMTPQQAINAAGPSHPAHPHNPGHTHEHIQAPARNYPSQF